MRFDVISLFPQMFAPFRQHGVTGRAEQRGLIDLHIWDPREYTTNVHRTVDDRPYGGGPGMVMKPEPLAAAIYDVRKASPDTLVVFLSPQGKIFDQRMAQTVSTLPSLTLICGRYEGVDERALEQVDDEWSIGDLVLSGGELAALIVIDSVARLIPGTLGHAESAQQDSFSGQLLDCPHYTRPEEFEGTSVPDVLLSGNHEAIRRWRLKQAVGRTWQRRPDLLRNRQLSREEQTLLNEYLRDLEGPNQ